MNVAVVDHIIPAALRARDQWVTWRREERDGRATKVPYRADGRSRASSTDRATWAPFNVALAAHRSGAFDGVGYVLAADDPFVGLDLDHVRGDAGAVAPWAQDIVATLDSYTEQSPSGQGFRIFVEAHMPPGGNRRGGVEIYAHGRYLTMTGQHIDSTPLTIERRDDVLRAVHQRYVAAPVRASGLAPRLRAVEIDDRELLIRAFRAANGDRFDALWSGDVSMYGGDHSAADLALCTHLAFWTGRDANRIDRLFRASALMRDKWDARHYSDGATYGERTIQVALGATTVFGGAA